MILLTCEEGPYLVNETRHAIRSLARVEPDEKVLLVLIAGSGAYDSQVKSWHPRIDILHVQPQLAIRVGEPGFHFAFKVLILEQALRQAGEAMIFLDGDVLVRKRIRPLLDELDRADLIVRYRPHLHLPGPMDSLESAKLNTGVIAIAHNERTLEYARRVKQSVDVHLGRGGPPMLHLEQRKVVTTIDQESMWLSYLEMKSELEFMPLDDRYNDSYFRWGSAIWHAKGTARSHAMYRYGVRRTEQPLRATLGGWRDLARHTREQIETARLWRRLLERNYRVPESELAARGFDPRGKRVMTIGSSFALENSWIRKADRTLCVDWDPVYYFRNRDKLRRKSRMPHRFVEDLRELTFHDWDLVLSDTAIGDVRTMPLVEQRTPAAERLQWNQLRKLRGNLPAHAKNGFVFRNFPD